MGIQGFNVYLENNKFIKYFDSTNDAINNTFKYIYLDFQSIIYDMFNYQENIINMMSNLLNNFDITKVNQQDYNNEIIFATLDEIRLLIKDTKLGDNLLKFTFMGTNFDMSNIFNYSATISDQRVIQNLKLSVSNYIKNKENFACLFIIEQIQKLLDNFNNLEECYIVFDGKPLVTKMIEQINRRATDSILTQIMNDIKKTLVDNAIMAEPQNITFDRTQINKDSPFVKLLIDGFKALKLKVKSDVSKDLKIEIIDNEDGEREHIINKKILAHVDSGADGNFLYFSPNENVVLLILILNILIREKGKTNYVNLIKFEVLDYTHYKFNTNFNNAANIEPTSLSTNTQTTNYVQYYKNGNVKNTIQALKLIFSQIGIKTQFCDILNFETTELLNNIVNLMKLKPDFAKKNFMIKQYIVLFTIFGNDFLPKLLSVSIRNVKNIIESYNKYLINTSKGVLCDFLNNDSMNGSENFNFMLKPDLKLNKQVLLDFFKLLCKNNIGDTDSCKNNEDLSITEILNNESKKRNFINFQNIFLNRMFLLNYNYNILYYEFLKYLLFGNYYIKLDDIIFDDLLLQLNFQQLLQNINTLLNMPNKTDDDILQLKHLENDYYNEVLIYISGEFINYINGNGQNPLVRNIVNIDTFENRTVPFSEIIKFDATIIADENAILQYIQGFQYIVDLYFTGNVTNKCWYYHYENPPRITELVKYMEDYISLDLFDYTGFYQNSDYIYDQISQSKTKNANIEYIKNLHPNKYYRLDDIFNCSNKRDVSKCPIKGDTEIVFLDNLNNPVNIMRSDYDTNLATNLKLNTMCNIASRLTGGGSYYKKYQKYKFKYIKLKQQKIKS
jgi:hypothetical protein